MRPTSVMLNALILAGLVTTPSIGQDAAVSTRTGAVSLSLSPLEGDSAGGERWRISAQESTSGPAVEGTVRVSGVPLTQPDKLGKVEWQLSGTELSGTVRAPGGGPEIASFKGTVTDQGMSGTFTTVMGQSGAWTWEGPLPDRSE